MDNKYERKVLRAEIPHTGEYMVVYMEFVSHPRILTHLLL